MVIVKFGSCCGWTDILYWLLFVHFTGHVDEIERGVVFVEGRESITKNKVLGSVKHSVVPKVCPALRSSLRLTDGEKQRD